MMLSYVTGMFFVLALCSLFGALNATMQEVRDKAYYMFYASCGGMLATQLLSFLVFIASRGGQ